MQFGLVNIFLFLVLLTLCCQGSSSTRFLQKNEKLDDEIEELIKDYGVEKDQLEDESSKGENLNKRFIWGSSTNQHYGVSTAEACAYIKAGLSDYLIYNLTCGKLNFTVIHKIRALCRKCDGSTPSRGKRSLILVTSVLEICSHYQMGYTPSQIAQKFQVTMGTIWQVLILCGQVHAQQSDKESGSNKKGDYFTEWKSDYFPKNKDKNQGKRSLLSNIWEICRYYHMGYTATQISHKLQVYLPTILQVLPHCPRYDARHSHKRSVSNKKDDYFSQSKSDDFRRNKRSFAPLFHHVPTIMSPQVAHEICAYTKIGFDVHLIHNYTCGIHSHEVIKSIMNECWHCDGRKVQKINIYGKRSTGVTTDHHKAIVCQLASIRHLTPKDIASLFMHIYSEKTILEWIKLCPPIQSQIPPSLEDSPIQDITYHQVMAICVCSLTLKWSPQKVYEDCLHKRLSVNVISQVSQMCDPNFQAVKKKDMEKQILNDKQLQNESPRDTDRMKETEEDHQQISPYSSSITKNQHDIICACSKLFNLKPREVMTYCLNGQLNLTVISATISTCIWPYHDAPTKSDENQNMGKRNKVNDSALDKMKRIIPVAKNVQHNFYAILCKLIDHVGKPDSVTAKHVYGLLHKKASLSEVESFIDLCKTKYW